MRDDRRPRNPRSATRRPGPRPTGARAGAAVLAVTSVLGLAACGGGDDTETTVAPDASASVPATTTSAAAPAAKGGTPEEQAAAVATAYIAAFTAGDGKAVCELFTPTERRRVAKAAGDDCPEGIRTAFSQGGGVEGFQQSLGGLKVGSSTVTGRRAVVRLVAARANGGAPLRMQLERVGASWRISRPGGGG
jgi:hypothetical protein